MEKWWLGVGLGACLALASGCGETESSGRAAGAAEAGAGAGAAGADAAPTPPDCSQYVDATGGQLMVRIVNETAGTLHLGQEAVTCVTDPLFVVRGADGRPLGRPGNCHNCSSVVATGMLGCTADCPQPLAITLEPGESTEAAWDGLFGVSVDLVKGCAKPDPGGIELDTCFLTKRVPAGAYTFSATASKELACGATVGTCPDCRPRESGGCETPQAVVGAPELSVEAVVSLGEGPSFGLEAPIELVFRD